MAATRSRPVRRVAARKTPARKSARPRTVPHAASTPLIARAPETSDEYLARLEALISDAGTHVYFDTSFLMWLAKLGRPARSQFLAWVAAEGATRFHVPLWTAHEFFKHQVRKTVFTELGNELSSFEKAAIRFYEKIRSFCCDNLFGFPSSGEIFLDEYKRAVQPLRAMLGLAKKNSEEEVDFANGEVAAFIDARLLPGALKRVLKNLELEERVRNRGTIPPSFNDAHKRTTREDGGDNSFGDLAFWREVLRHAADIPARTLIVATGDRKNDWFVNYHGTDTVSPDLRKKIPNPRPVPLPHPLLVREASDSGAGELALIDPVYCAALMERKGQHYKASASAAMDTALPKLVAKDLERQVWAARVGQVARIIATPIPPEPAEGAISPSSIATEEAASALLKIELLKAGPDDCSPTARQFFEKLGVAPDVATRAELYGQIDWDSLEDWSPIDLVVLGKKLTRAAEDGDPSAQRLISDLRDQAPTIPSTVANAVYLGALGAIYLDEALTRRVPSGSAVAQTLLDVVCIPAVRPASSLLGAALSEASPQPPYLPGGDASTIELEFIVRASADNKPPADLVALNLQGRNLVTDLQTEEGLRFTSIFKRAADSRDFSVAELCDAVARFHLLPRQFLQPNLEKTSVLRVAEFAGVDIET
jgi:hypothetical protein